VTDTAVSPASESNRLTVLITDLSPAHAGASSATVELAQGLSHRGHRPIVFSPGAADVAVSALRQQGVTVVNRLSQVGIAPDIIHGQGNVAAVMAMAFFPNCPAIFCCSSPDAAVDRPPLLPRIQRYVATDETCGDRLRRDSAPVDRIVLLPGATDADSRVAQCERLYADVLANAPQSSAADDMHALGVFLEDFLISPDVSRPWTGLHRAIAGETADAQEQALKLQLAKLQETLLARFDDLGRRIGSAPARPARKQVQPIDLSAALRHGDAGAEYGSNLSINTARGQWQYAVTLACPPVSGPGTIVVDAEVEKGAIGFGVNGPDLKAYVGDEMVLEAADGRQKVEIAIADGALHRLVLVVRNVSDRGRSRGTIFGAAVVTEG
jgi:hypothetical protein